MELAEYFAARITFFFTGFMLGVAITRFLKDEAREVLRQRIEFLKDQLNQVKINSNSPRHNNKHKDNK